MRGELLTIDADSIFWMFLLGNGSVTLYPLISGENVLVLVDTGDSIEPIELLSKS